MYYISTDTVVSAYLNLTGLNLTEESTAFYFFVLKGCGFNRTTYCGLDALNRNALEYSSRLCSLFSPEEQQPEKYSYLNPFTMNNWPSQAPTEALKKWSSSRLWNNIEGGGTQWREIMDIDANSGSHTVKFKYGYIDIIKRRAFGNERINLLSLAVWANRFTAFPAPITVNDLCKEFIHSYKLTSDELAAFFETKSEYSLTFENEMYDTCAIRQMIGNPPLDSAWSVFVPDSKKDDYILSKYEYTNVCDGAIYADVDEISKLLEKYNQVILAGPPGTSKSYYANQIARKYNVVKHIQFHPQYSYQEFVGGYVVDGTEVKYKKGLILRLLEEYEEDKNYLIIIDELNRANVSQVFGDLIQCLDRPNDVEIAVDGENTLVSLPDNIKILATMNTTDRTLGTIDYALKRRFITVYCAPNPNLLIGLCPANDFISLSDFLRKINANLLSTTLNKDLSIGHAVFLDSSVMDDDGKCVWTFESFRYLYNYKILPLVEDYCSNNKDIIISVVGNRLSQPLELNEFTEALEEFVSI